MFLFCFSELWVEHKKNDFFIKQFYILLFWLSLYGILK